MEILFIGERKEPPLKIFNLTKYKYHVLYSNESEVIYREIKGKFKDHIVDATKIDAYSIYSAFEKLYHLMINSKSVVRIDITGASKISLISALMVASVMKKEVEITYLASNQIVHLPLLNVELGLQRLLERKSKIKIKVLEALLKEDLNGVQLSRVLGKAKSDISYLMKELSKNNIIIRRNGRYSLTEIGRDVFRIIKFIYEIKN